MVISTQKSAASFLVAKLTWPAQPLIDERPVFDEEIVVGVAPSPIEELEIVSEDRIVGVALGERRRRQEPAEQQGHTSAGHHT